MKRGARRQAARRAISSWGRWGALAAVLVPSGGCTHDASATFNAIGLETPAGIGVDTEAQLASSQRLVLVHFERERPSSLRVVDCPVAATYGYRELGSAALESTEINDATQLAVHLPLLQESVTASTQDLTGLTLEWMEVGVHTLENEEALVIPAGPDAAECAQATHYVSRLTVGAYQLRRATSKGAEQQGGYAGTSSKLGGFESCRGSREPGCQQPLRVELRPITDKQRSETAALASPPAPPQETRVTDVAADGGSIVRKGLGLEIDEVRWRPGHFMARALERLLSGVVSVCEETSFGLDGRASSIVAGYLPPQGRVTLRRDFELGTRYLVFAAGATGAALSLTVEGTDGQMIASNQDPRGVPVVQFTLSGPAGASGSECAAKDPDRGQAPPVRQLVVEVESEASEDFGTIVVMREGGYSVPPALLHGVFQNLLDTGLAANQRVRDLGRGGLVFHEGNLALYGTILHPGETIRQGGFVADAPLTVFIGVGHDASVDLDIVLQDASGRTVAEDREDDPMPIVTVEADPDRSPLTFGLIYANGKEPTLGTALVLEVPAPVAQQAPPVE